MFDEPHQKPPYEEELEARFTECMANNVAVRCHYERARACGMSEELRLKAVVIALADLNKRATGIIASAIMHGIPITGEVAELRNRIVGRSS